MAQGIFGGATSYEEQSLPDILSDIEYWMKKANEVKKLLRKSREIAIDSGYWFKIGCEFQIELENSILYIDTLLFDMDLVKKSICNDMITEREVGLLSNIGMKCVEINHNYGQTYHNGDKWQDYGNPDFAVVEDMYKTGRDFFVTLQDAGNAASRLNDYVQRGSIMRNELNISGSAQGAQIQVGANQSSQTMNVNSRFEYDEVERVLKEIEGYLSDNKLIGDLGSDYPRMKELVSETKHLAAQKAEPSLIKKGLKKITNLVGNVGTSLITKGICELLKQYID